MPLSQVIPEQYPQQLQSKLERIQNQFAEFSPPKIEVFDSPPLHFRMRAEFKIWHNDDDSYYAMFKREQPKHPVRIDQFPIGSQLINQLMQDIMKAVKSTPLLRYKLFQVEFLTTLSGEALVSLIYHKPLGDDWVELAKQLQKNLGINIIGRSKKQRLVLQQDFVTETLTVNQRQYHFQQVENSFTQPNARVNQKMLAWALEHSKNNGGDLVEIECGEQAVTPAECGVGVDEHVFLAFGLRDDVFEGCSAKRVESGDWQIEDST